MADTEVIEKGKEHLLNPPDDMSSYVMDIMSEIPLFLIVVAAILYVLLDSSIYNNKILAKINSEYIDDVGNKTSNGIIITGIIFGIILGLLNLLHTSNIV